MSGAVVLVHHRSLPQHADVAEREIAGLIATVQALEPGWGGITMLQDANDPSHFTLIEHWASQQVFLGPHAAAASPGVRPKAGTFLAGPPEISFWHAIGGS